MNLQKISSYYSQITLYLKSIPDLYVNKNSGGISYNQTIHLELFLMPNFFNLTVNINNK